MKLMLLATGGTIACTPTENGLAPTLHAQDLLDILGPSLPCEVEARDVFQMDSSNMQPEEWSVLEDAISAYGAASEIAAFDRGFRQGAQMILQLFQNGAQPIPAM